MTLPVGLVGHGCPGRDRTYVALVQSQDAEPAPRWAINWFPNQASNLTFEFQRLASYQLDDSGMVQWVGLEPTT
jgi:hypothetical protein